MENNNQEFETQLKDFEKKAIEVIKKGKISELNDILDEVLEEEK